MDWGDFHALVRTEHDADAVAQATDRAPNNPYCFGTFELVTMATRDGSTDTCGSLVAAHVPNVCTDYPFTPGNSVLGRLNKALSGDMPVADYEFVKSEVSAREKHA